MLLNQDFQALTNQITKLTSTKIKKKCFDQTLRQGYFLPNDPKNLDPSYKTALDDWDCLYWKKYIYSNIKTPGVIGANKMHNKFN